MLVWPVLQAAATDVFAASGPSMRVVARIGDAQGTFAHREVKNGSVLRSGDRLQLRLATESDAYVYVIAYGSSGTAVLLHPFSGRHEEARLGAGEERVFPREDVYLPLDEQPGGETLYLIGSEVPLGDMATLLAGMEAKGDDVAAVSRVVRDAYPQARQVSFKHIGARPLVGVDLSGVRKSSSGLPEPSPGGGEGGLTAPAEAVGLSAGAGWSVRDPGQFSGESAQASPRDHGAAGEATVQADGEGRGQPGVESSALRRAKEAAGIDPHQFQGILSKLPGAGGEVPEGLRRTVREEGVLSAEGSRIPPLRSGESEAKELGLN